MKNSFSFSLVLTGVFIATGIATGGYYVGRAIERFKTHDRTVIVKGLSERIVKADLATWNLCLKNSGDDLQIVEEKLERDAKELRHFLHSNGFVDAEISSEGISVIDKAAREYGEQHNTSQRFIVSTNVYIRTYKVELVSTASQKIGELVRKNVIVSGEQSYHYTKFKVVRPEMISESIKSARQAAEQFAKDSGAKVGCIRTANQGVFSITGVNSYLDENDYGETRNIDKKIRVVTTVTFSLEK